MSESFELKPISRAAVPHALDKAEHYRLLNDPRQAESICLDVLAADPDNQRALVVLILAMSDRLGSSTARASYKEVKGYLEKVSDDYERAYFSGLVAEREARAVLNRGMSAGFAYEGFRFAMTCYEHADELRPEGNDDARLRYNSCVRAIQSENLTPREDDRNFPLE